MVVRGFASTAVCRSKQLRNLLIPFLPNPILHKPSSFSDVICKVYESGPAVRPLPEIQRCPLVGGVSWFHSTPPLYTVNKAVEAAELTGSTAVDGSADVKNKRKKLKGKRAVVRWLKFFRWKKKKDYQRMTAEEQILYKLRKARKKEEKILEGLKKIEPKESSETAHDPEILTPEEHFFFLKMGQKSKNYVPVGRRGIYQGVILNMHLHWKKHQTLTVVVKTFSPEEVKEIAVELARLSGGIVLDIQEENTIIMYRGKNYSQPPTEIMSPRTTLPRKKVLHFFSLERESVRCTRKWIIETSVFSHNGLSPVIFCSVLTFTTPPSTNVQALDKSKYRDGLRAVRKYIPRLEQDLELLQAKAANRTDCKTRASEETQVAIDNADNPGGISHVQPESSDKLRELIAGDDGCHEDDDPTKEDPDMGSDSEALSDIFETESDTDNDEKVERPLYLNEFEKFPVQSGGHTDFEEHLRQISADSKKAKSLDNGNEPELDEVDRLVLQAASLLKKKRR
ncbi:hypothetical protein RJ640_025325 [Escallonia rubra]|uniref:CRM domain-containing protein n=1 Tax=Escallonia rubra TaxID=112253 RepID=A0AA88QPE6_9ASTE|nr:hypothetical protein RJ640_025325 [Escallonia rubra]